VKRDGTPLTRASCSRICDELRFTGEMGVLGWALTLIVLVQSPCNRSRHCCCSPDPHNLGSRTTTSKGPMPTQDGTRCGDPRQQKRLNLWRLLLCYSNRLRRYRLLELTRCHFCGLSLLEFPRFSSVNQGLAFVFIQNSFSSANALSKGFKRHPGKRGQGAWYTLVVTFGRIRGAIGGLKMGIGGTWFGERRE
jgi:hypothetical protein